MYVYIKSSDFGCYQIKQKLPIKYKNIDRKKDKEYKEWYNKEKKKFTELIKKKLDNNWWLNLDNKEKEKLYNKYKSKISKKDFEKFIKNRRWRFIDSGYKCLKYTTLNDISEIKNI